MYSHSAGCSCSLANAQYNFNDIIKAGNIIFIIDTQFSLICSGQTFWAMP
jgi:hypothetical protein